jgi:hypothetical protein
MKQFRKGDIVRVAYTRAEDIECWMDAYATTRPGPDDVGVVMHDTPSYAGARVTAVHFPMIGIAAMSSSQLKLVEGSNESERDSENKS